MGGRRGKHERASCPCASLLYKWVREGCGSNSPPPKDGGGGQGGEECPPSQVEALPLRVSPPPCAWAL